MKNLLRTGLIVFVALTYGCTSAQQAKQQAIQTISADELLKLQSTGVKVVDVRTLGEVNRGKIPGAMHVELDANLVEKMSSFPKDKPIIVYCHAGPRSAQAAELLQAAGYTVIYNYYGGIADWLSKGKKVE
jgi:rhodanese-related sulfurtransferase